MSALDEKLGSPDIKLGNLQIWVHGYQFLDATEYWDANWIRATAFCSDNGAQVEVTGSFLHLPELSAWTKDCEKVYETHQSSADLKCMEPELNVQLQVRNTGKIQMVVSITPNNVTQSHTFKFEIDQSYLPGFLSGCRNVLKKYPIRAKEEQRR